MNDQADIMNAKIINLIILIAVYSFEQNSRMSSMASS